PSAVTASSTSPVVIEAIAELTVIVWWNVPTSGISTFPKVMLFAVVVRLKIEEAAVTLFTVMLPAMLAVKLAGLTAVSLEISMSPLLVARVTEPMAVLVLGPAYSILTLLNGVMVMVLPPRAVLVG